MNRKLLNILIIIGVIILIGVMGIYGGWWNELAGVKKSETIKPVPSSIPGIVINEPKLTGWDGQKKTWEIAAGKMWQTDDGNFIYFDNIENGVIYSSDKRVDFTAGWARFEKMRQLLYIGAGFEARSDEAYFGTAEAVMNYRTQELTCPKEAIYSETNKTIKANTLRLNFRDEEILLKGDVELTQDQNVIKAGSIIYNSKNKQYRLLEPKGITIFP